MIVATVIPVISICLLVILATIVVFTLWKHRKVCFTHLSTTTHTSEHISSSSAAAVELYASICKNENYTDDSEQLDADNRKPKEDDPLLQESVCKFLLLQACCKLL